MLQVTHLVKTQIKWQGFRQDDELDVMSRDNAGVIKWDPFSRDETIQIYGNFEGFTL